MANPWPNDDSPFTEEPIRYYCQKCNHDIITWTKPAPTRLTHTYAFLLLLTGCICCIWMPYYCHSGFGVRHYCPLCNKYLGQWEPPAPVYTV